MATVRAWEIFTETLERIPPKYRFFLRPRQKKNLILGLVLFVVCLVFIKLPDSDQQPSGRLVNDDTIVLKSSDDIPEDIEKDVAENPKVFKWEPSSAAMDYQRLFYNHRQMWTLELAKSSMKKLELADSRSPECKKALNTSLEVNIILDVATKNVAHFPFTLGSIMQSVGSKVSTIYVIQDGSLAEGVQRLIEELVWEITKVKVLRLSPKPLSQARNEALKQATGDIVVFFSSGVLATIGWLEPLIERVLADPKSLAVPIYDRVDFWEDNAFYSASLHTIVNTIRQDMNVHLYPLFDFPATPHVINSPAVRGDVFAVRKQEFLAAGGYDGSLRSDGAAHVELTMRHWLCHGSIQACRCSRVAVQSIGEQVIDSLEDALYIARLWTPDAVPSTSNTKVLAAAEKRAAQRQVPRRSCSKAGTWITTRLVPQAGDTAATKDTVLFAGKLKVDTGICVVPRANGIVYLGTCTHENVGLTAKEMEFKYTKYGYITFGNNLCLTTGGTAESELIILNLETCVSGEPRQRWAYSDKRVLKSVKGGCLKEYTNPLNPNEEITQRIPCDYIYDEWGGIKLVRWEFVSI